MPVYQLETVKPIIGRIIRTARLNDLTYADDIIEWIGEAQNRLLIKWRLPKTHKELTIKDHAAKLPCELAALDAVIYNGVRLRKGTSTIDAKAIHWNKAVDNIMSYFVSDTTIQPADLNSQNISLLRGLNIKQLETSIDTRHFYDIEYNYIKTSFKDGCIVICYKVKPLDKEGYPVIPDIEEAKSAVFWYICAQLCFTGYKLPNPKHDYDYCDAKAEKFFRKAKNIIRTLSEDEKESAVQLLNNLIPPANYYNTFFISGEQRKYVNA